MPLYKVIQHDPHTTVFVWQITESLADLFDMARLTDRSIFRIGGTSSIEHKKGFISVRCLLQAAGTDDFQLYYDEFGKPNLTDGRHISISHSHEFSTIIVSNRKCGIDLELRRDKIIRIANKFVEDGFEFPNRDDKEEYISRLTVDWGIKESVFKIRNEPGISFKQHISVTPFDLESGKTSALLTFGDVRQKFEVFFTQVDNYMLVYAFEDNA